MGTQYPGNSQPPLSEVTPPTPCKLSTGSSLRNNRLMKQAFSGTCLLEGGGGQDTIFQFVWEFICIIHAKLGIQGQPSEFLLTKQSLAFLCIPLSHTRGPGKVPGLNYPMQLPLLPSMKLTLLRSSELRPQNFHHKFLAYQYKGGRGTERKIKQERGKKKGRENKKDLLTYYLIHPCNNPKRGLFNLL